MGIRTYLVTKLPKPLRRGLRWAREAAKLYANVAYDLRRYLRYSATVDPYSSQPRFRALLQKRQHIVEKGLSLPSPRPGFGVENIYLLATELVEYVERYGADALARSCVDALNSYHAFTTSAGKASPVPIELLAVVEHELRSEAAFVGVGSYGGVELVRAVDVETAGRKGFDEMAASRRSVRSFRPELISRQLILDATRIAQMTPSVCNRQAWRVHFYQGDVDCHRVLALQTGNRGFTESIKNLVVVTCRLSAFMSAGERNEAYIDGGMFSMSLVYALHARGVGSCCLNLCLESVEDRLFHLVGDIPEEEVLVMAIAVGYLPDEFKIALSKRGPLEGVIEFHSSLPEEMVRRGDQQNTGQLK